MSRRCVPFPERTGPPRADPPDLRSPAEPSPIALADEQPPLVGFVQPPPGAPFVDPVAGTAAEHRSCAAGHPSTDVPSERPLPRTASCALRSRESHLSGSRSVLVVVRHLDGFLRSEVAGLLHPAAGLGFAAFHVDRFRSQLVRVRATMGVPARSPRRNPPLEGFPPTTAVPRHRGRCPLAVPPRRALPLPPPPLPEAMFQRPRGRERRLRGLAPSPGP